MRVDIAFTMVDGRAVFVLTTVTFYERIHEVEFAIVKPVSPFLPLVEMI